MIESLKYGMRGRFCEFQEKGKTRFVEINVIKFDRRQEKRLKSIDCFEDSILNSYMKLINAHISENTKYLYKVFTYHGEVGISELYEFNSSMSDYEQIGFANIDSLLEYCKNRWGIDETSFVPKNETNIPY